jgi:predicted dehydrogenase
MCDKPATATLEEAQTLARLVAGASTLYGLTYTYTGYPMVREARERVRAGALGEIRKIVVEYPQGWLSTQVEKDAGNRQAAWRTDPAQAGLGGCIGDIGVHAFQMAEYVGGCRVTEILPDLGHVVPGRALDDDCNILLRFAGGVRGVLHASQISTGARNGLRLRIWGSLGGLDWSHETPDRLTFDWPDQPTQIYHAGAPYLSPAVQRTCRLPVGHPEGFIEAFANLYRDFAAMIRGEAPNAPVPGIADGLRGMTFVARATENPHRAGWISLD